ncbi:hypothetical protein SR39_06925 [Methylobacterium radiotolerans]|nr:hypothetical protein SR39_06925 [Methylobacterium radiotolerans]
MTAAGTAGPSGGRKASGSTLTPARLQLQHHQDQGVDIHALDGQRGAQIVGGEEAPVAAEGDQPVEGPAIQNLRHVPPPRPRPACPSRTRPGGAGYRRPRAFRR